MKVSSTEVPPRQVALDIEVEQERLDRAMEQAFRRLAGRVNVPGFRRGKAPRPMVERVVGRDRIVEDALDELLPVVVNEAIEQEGVSAFARPRVESIEFNPLRLRATVPLEPKVELGDYHLGLHVEPTTVNVDDEQVDAVVQRLRDSHAQWVPVERPVQLGDRVGIDVVGRVAEADRTVVDSRDAEYVVDPQGAAPAEGFADQLVGLSAGESKQFTLPVRTSGTETEQADFTVTLHWVKEKELPELDETFAQQVGDYADVEALRTEIRHELQTREEERVSQETQALAIDKLVELSTVEFPPQLVDREADHLYETFTHNMEQQGLKLDQYLRLTGKDEAALRAEVRTEAETRVRRSLALDAFATAEQISVNESELSGEGGEPAESLAMANPRSRERLEGVVRERKALARLVELAAAGSAAAGTPTTSDVPATTAVTPTPASVAAPSSASDAPAAAAAEPESTSKSRKIGGAVSASADTEPQAETPTPTPEAAVANAQEQP
ncbi:MAG: trigger factor [Chloroflexi bacterium]|nr:trigger factor [Chloroflexota bacterium]